MTTELTSFVMKLLGKNGGIKIDVNLSQEHGYKKNTRDVYMIGELDEPITNAHIKDFLNFITDRENKIDKRHTTLKKFSIDNIGKVAKKHYIIRWAESISVPHEVDEDGNKILFDSEYSW